MQGSGFIQGSFRVHGSGIRVQGSGFMQGSFRVQGSGIRVQGSSRDHSGCRVQSSGFRVQGAEFGIQGAGFRFRVGVRLPDHRARRTGSPLLQDFAGSGFGFSEH